MRRTLCILLGLGFLAAACHAETRWCSITGRGANDSLIYPPIARLARVSGVVLGRLIYLPSGLIKDFEAISGPKMLQSYLGYRLKNWTIKTDAKGEELCQTLIIAEFRLQDTSDPLPDRPVQPALPSITRLSVDGLRAEEYVISDPSPLIFWNPFGHLRYIVKRTISRVFAPHNH